MPDSTSPPAPPSLTWHRSPALIVKALKDWSTDQDMPCGHTTLFSGSADPYRLIESAAQSIAVIGGAAARARQQGPEPCTAQAGMVVGVPQFEFFETGHTQATQVSCQQLQALGPSSLWQTHISTDSNERIATGQLLIVQDDSLQKTITAADTAVAVAVDSQTEEHFRPLHDAELSLQDIRCDQETWSGIALFQSQLPVFQGHFPGKAIVPGVHILAAMHKVIEAANGRACALQACHRCKWLHILEPEQTIQLTVSKTQGSAQSWQCQAFKGDQKLALARLTVDPCDRTP